MSTFAADDLCNLSMQELDRQITELAAHIQAATCRWLFLVAELDRRQEWAAWGAKSCAGWLSWRCGVSPGAAREQVRVARRLSDMPLTCAAFGRGELSYSKVRAISRIATPENEPALVELARHSTAAQLDRIVAGYRGSTASLDEANAAHDRRYVSLSWEDDGALTLRARLSADEGAVLMRAIEASRDQLWDAVKADVSAETPVADEAGRPSAADALVQMAESSLSAPSAAASGGDRYQVVVHTEAAVLSGDEDGRCEIEDGPALPAESARRLACDASLVAITERQGRPLAVGRKTRSVPGALRRALRSRDGGCCFPGCDQRRFVDAHHVKHWADGGETKLSNLLLLCRRHHRLVHEGGYRVEACRDRRFRFRRPDGRRIPAVPRAGRSDSGCLPEVNRRAGVAIRPGTGVALSAGDSLDYGLAVEGLLANDGFLDWPMSAR